MAGLLRKPRPSMPETSAQAITDNASLWRLKHALSIFFGWARPKTSHAAPAFPEPASLPPIRAAARAARDQWELQNPSSDVPRVEQEHAGKALAGAPTSFSHCGP